MYIKNPRQVPGDYFTRFEWAKLPDSHLRLMVGLALLADPGGSGEVDPRRIRREVWQAGEEGASWPSIDAVQAYLLDLERAGFLRFYLDPAGSGTPLFRISARWYAVLKQGQPVWLPPQDDPETPEIPPFRKPVEGGVRAGEGERASAGERAEASESAGECPSGTPRIPQLRISPSAFCPEHPGGPPPRLDCRDCGTARQRKDEHREARQARAAALQLPPTLRGPVLAQLDAKILALEEAAARDLAGTTDTDEPEEFLGPDGLVDHT